MPLPIIPDSDAPIIAEQIKTMSHGQIARERGCGIGAVRRFCRKHGLKSPRGRRGKKERTYRKPKWTREKKALLLSLAKENGGVVNLSVSRKLRVHLTDAQVMHQMLTEYAALPKPVIVVENGIRVTRCPPAYARGAWGNQRVGSTARKGGV